MALRKAILKHYLILAFRLDYKLWPQRHTATLILSTNLQPLGTMMTRVQERYQHSSESVRPDSSRGSTHNGFSSSLEPRVTAEPSLILTMSCDCWVVVAVVGVGVLGLKSGKADGGACFGMLRAARNDSPWSHIGAVPRKTNSGS